MGNDEQMQQILALMQRQMDNLESLREENSMLREAATQATATATARDVTIRNTPQGKTKRPDRPVINANIDDREWALFEDTWNRYKVMTGLSSEEEIRMELRASCSVDVNKFLFEFVGPTVLNNATEEELLNHIRKIAVKSTHKEVHRMNFGKLSQSEKETITHYVARLKAKAALCDFNVVCTVTDPPTPVSYADQMIAQQMIAGLRNQQHQSKILSEASILPTLLSKIERLQSLETTEESANEMQRTPISAQPPTQAAAARSQFKRNKKIPATVCNEEAGDSTQGKICNGCGRSSHPAGKTMARKDCPAFKKSCDSCGIKGHFKAVCRKSQARAAPSHVNEEQSDEYEDVLDDIEAEASSSFAFATRNNGDFRLAPKLNERR